MNENGQRLFEICHHCLRVNNVYVKHHHRVSWIHPRSNHWHQLDYILTRNLVKLVLSLQEAYPGKKGFSFRSVRRFCLNNGIHVENHLSNEELGTPYEGSCCSVGSFLHEFILLQISPHCLAGHFLIACIKISVKCRIMKTGKWFSWGQNNPKKSWKKMRSWNIFYTIRFKQTPGKFGQRSAAEAFNLN